MSKLLVVIDPGHTGDKINQGIIENYFESDKMYILSEYEKDALKKYGIDVKLTRSKAEDPSLYERGQIAVNAATKYTDVLFISNHSNYDAEAINGVEGYVSQYLPGSEELGYKLVEAVANVMGSEVKGIRSVKDRRSDLDYYGVIRAAVNNAVSIDQALNNSVKYVYVLEHGYHTNDTECTKLNDNATLKLIAEAKAKVIAGYFNIAPLADVPIASILPSNEK